jgi:hypothetical protein
MVTYHLVVKQSIPFLCAAGYDAIKQYMEHHSSVDERTYLFPLIHIYAPQCGTFILEGESLLSVYLLVENETTIELLRKFLLECHNYILRGSQIATSICYLIKNNQANRILIDQSKWSEREINYVHYTGIEVIFQEENAVEPLPIPADSNISIVTIESNDLYLPYRVEDSISGKFVQDFIRLDEHMFDYMKYSYHKLLEIFYLPEDNFGISQLKCLQDIQQVVMYQLQNDWDELVVNPYPKYKLN